MFLMFWKKFEKEIINLKNVSIKNDDDHIMVIFTIKRGGKGVKQKITDILVESVVIYYKNKFLEENIALPEEYTLYKNALCKSLALFDRLEDITEVKENFCLTSYLNINSFYFFKLADVRTRWKSICDLFKENLDVVLASDSFVELIKYLISTTEPSCDVALIYIDNAKICIKNNNGEDLTEPINLRDASSGFLVANELISIAPGKIKIKYNSEENTELTNTIKNLFDEKVVLTT